ncbi:MAG: hypothetical protein GY803_17660 [Chloroflexi bacterium]|nr:hypothetical protein [Chloroflexota bacterium]
MNTESSSYGNYSKVAQLLHWLSALLIIILWPLGIIMTKMDEGSWQLNMIRLHVAIGLAVLLLTIIRIGWRLTSKSPKTPPGLTPVQVRTLKIAYTLQYLFLFLLTMSGVGMMLAIGSALLGGDFSREMISGLPPQSLHRISSRVFIVLFVMHLGGVIRHQLTKGDVMARMGIPLSGR